MTAAPGAGVGGRRERRRARHAAEREHGLRLPLVLAASRTALEQAAALLPPRTILENLVADAIVRGDVRHRPDGIVIALTPGVQAVCLRTSSPLTGRRAWRSVAVPPAEAVPTPSDGARAGVRGLPPSDVR